MTLSIVIVNYNTSHYICQTIESIYRSNVDVDYEIIVVDNYSHDHTCEMIEHEFPKVRIIKNKSNVGFSKGINIGQKFAKGEYFCFLNPDTLISDNTFEVLLEYLDKSNITYRIGNERKLK